jgi:nucleotide-binding universal stress UspA family protein
MKIMIATDGSAYSKAAVEECCKLIVDPVNTEVKILSVYENVYAIAAEPFAISAAYYQDLTDAAKNQATNFVNDAEGILQAYFPDKGLRVTTGTMNGPPEQQIVEAAKDWNADMIVVGSHGRGFWGRLVGSVSDAVVHHAPCSVLVVRPKGREKHFENN